MKFFVEMFINRVWGTVSLHRTLEAAKKAARRAANKDRRKTRIVEDHIIEVFEPQ